MVKNGCHYAVLEISSEGLAQHRHYGINFDIALFTNLTPEHLESHGGFEQYKRAKAILFQSLSHHGLNPAKLAINPKAHKKPTKPYARLT
jgi:UDP-N-acetylmuramoyl-L-alanyl-D-glutamate--2,6-diaminopimelate ligase